MKPKRIRFTPNSSKQIVEHNQLEYIHHVLQECGNGNVDNAMVDLALEFVEDIREPLLNKLHENKLHPDGFACEDFWDD